MSAEKIIYFDYETATRESFEASTEPYEYLADLADRDGDLAEQQALNFMSDFALEKFGIKNLKTLYKAYKRDLDEPVSKSIGAIRLTDFEGQPLELSTTWQCDERGVRKGAEVACTHPIMISKRFLNQESGEVKVELAYKIFGHWKKTIVKRASIVTGREITKLANLGISVSNKNSDNLIEYLQELEELNSDIPIIESVTKLGWVDAETFVPYSSEVIFDGEAEFKQLFESVREEGDKQLWISKMQELRSQSPIVSMVLAGALASPLLEWISVLPGFIHIWSGVSGSGKTILAMIAASCFGNPESGHYMQSFNSTTMAQEKRAGLLNSCPFVIDESQLNTGRYSVYFLAAGQGRARGRQDGSVAPVESWHNTIISTGEKPLVTRSDGQGAFARVIEIELKKVLFTFEQGNRLADFLRENYGFAGPMMVQAIKELGKAHLREGHMSFARQLKDKNPHLQEKQVMFGAALLLAEEIATNYIFQDDASENGLTVDFVIEHLKTDSGSSISQRAYEETLDWIARNGKKFEENSSAYEVYGESHGSCVYIIRSVFNEFMDSEGYSDRAVLSEWADRGLIETYLEKSTGYVRFDKPKRINEQMARCICLKFV